MSFGFTFGVELPPDNASYGLSNPVPSSQLRDFNPDRPDKTNGSHTLDAGHFQLEMDMLSYTRDRDAGASTNDYTLANANLRIGLTSFADLQLQIPCYQINNTHASATGQTSHDQGIGDLTVALKLNAWGNDGTGSAGGVEFSIKTPTGARAVSNGRTEGSATFLWDSDLPDGFGLGINSGVAVDFNDSGSGYHADLVESVSVSHDIIGPLSAYVEFYSLFNPKQTGDWIGSVDVGFVYGIGKNMEVDAGVNLGVTNTAPDQQAFVGFSIRY